MTENNIYDTPQAQLVEQPVSTGVTTLASRWARLGAAIIDSLTIGIVTLPVMYFTGGFDGISAGRQPGFLYMLGMTTLSALVYFAINYRFLIANGQTVGKKVLDIRIVDLSGNIPSFQRQLIVRYLVATFPALIPVVGQFLGAIDVLFIFGKEKRCVHDFIARTRVVNC
jgi:uncharacterized RDD family membrane protein YckC